MLLCRLVVFMIRRLTVAAFTLAAISVARSVALNLIIRDIFLLLGIRKKRENKRFTYRTVKNATILRFENDDTITVGAFINDRV